MLLDDELLVVWSREREGGGRGRARLDERTDMNSHLF